MRDAVPRIRRAESGLLHSSSRSRTPVVRPLLSAATAALLACACATSKHDARSVVFETLDQPFDLEQIEQLGREIHELDAASATAWDALVRTGGDRDLESKGVVGYLAVRHEDAIAVHYVDSNEALIETVWVGAGRPRPWIERPDEIRRLDEPILSRWRARQAALERPFRMCTASYNLVVLKSPLPERPGWIVYLLAATTDPNLRVMGGDRRVWVSPEIEITAFEALSRGCPIFAIEPNAVAQSLSNFGIPRPLETHVFDTLLYDTTLYVFNEEGSWEIDRGKITKTEE